MVTLGKSRFYKRTGTTNNPMNIDDQKSLEQSELRETITRWRAHRVELLESGGSPISHGQDDHSVSCHSVGCVYAWSSLRLRRVPNEEKSKVYVVEGNSWLRYNADGFLCHSSINRMMGTHPGAVTGYTQLFRSGIAEYGFCHSDHSGGTLANKILGQAIEKEMVYCFQDANNRLRREDAREPYMWIFDGGNCGKEFLSEPDVHGVSRARLHNRAELIFFTRSPCGLQRTFRSSALSENVTSVGRHPVASRRTRTDTIHR